VIKIQKIRLMEERKNPQESGNTFLLGLILGSIGTLLFTTKKGRELLKEVTEKGLEKFTEFEDRLKRAEQTDAVDEEGDYVEPQMRPIPDIEEVDEKEKVKLAKIEEKLEKAAPAKKEPIPTAKPQRTVKRFFRMKKN
jgi:gas vesicle protein